MGNGEMDTHIDRTVEWIHVDLLHRPVIDVGTQAIPPVLLVVRYKVLRTSLDTNRLNTHDSFICALTIEVWIGAKSKDIAHVNGVILPYG
jgi:hypothetical protein